MTMHVSPSSQPVVIIRKRDAGLRFFPGTAQPMTAQQAAEFDAQKAVAAATAKVLAMVNKTTASFQPVVQEPKIEPPPVQVSAQQSSDIVALAGSNAGVAQTVAQTGSGCFKEGWQNNLPRAAWQDGLRKVRTPIGISEVKLFALPKLQAKQAEKPSVACQERAEKSHRNTTVTLEDIDKPLRNACMVAPRQRLMWLAKMLTGRSLPEIGRRFGGRDHTTVLHAVRKIEGLRVKDVTLCEQLDTIAAEIVLRHRVREKLQALKLMTQAAGTSVH